MEWIRHLGSLMLPPGLCLLPAVAGLFAWRRAPRLARALVAGAVASLLLLSMPVVSGQLAHATGDYAVFDPRNTDAGAIVVLAGESMDAPEYGGTTVGPRSLQRLRLGARLARQTGLPLLLAGGRMDPDEVDSLAGLMDRVLREDYGLAARWRDESSYNTHENAENAARILRAEGIRRVVLVTSYSHMHRAVANFQAAGLDPIAAPTDFPRTEYHSLRAALLPRAAALCESALALHELYGLAGRALGLAV